MERDCRSPNVSPTPVSNPSSRPVVLKFGGTSVRDAKAIRRLCEIVSDQSLPTVLVVSALAGVTDTLVDLGQRAADGGQREFTEQVETVHRRHIELAEQVVSGAARDALVAVIDEQCRELEILLHAVGVLRELSPRSADAIAALGELLSSRLVAGALSTAGVPARWVDAQTLLVTDDSHDRARPIMDVTTDRVRDTVRPLLEAGQVPVIGGYVGATEDGVTTTLGRGGSDYSAAVFGSILDAHELQIWTDVDGMLTADPRVVSEARLVPRLSFAEASELAYFGAKVLHPATIQPAVERNIPVRILNARHPERLGTTITAEGGDGSAVTALACKRGLTVIEITSARMLMAHGFLKRLFEVFDRLETPVDVVTTSEVNVSVTIDNPCHLPELVAELSTFANVSTEPDMALLCVVGEGLQADPRLFPRVVGMLDDIACRMVSQSASRRNLTFVLRETDLPRAMKRLHDQCFATLHPATL